MESIAIVLLLIVLGGGALLVALIYAIVTGTSRSDRLARLEREQTNLRMGLHEAHARIAQLEQAMGDAMHRIEWLRAHPPALPPAPAALAEVPPQEETPAGAKAEEPPFAQEGSGAKAEEPPFAQEGSGTKAEEPPFAQEGSGAKAEEPPFAQEGSGTKAEEPPFAQEGSGTKAEEPPFVQEGSGAKAEEPPASGPRQVEAPAVPPVAAAARVAEPAPPSAPAPGFDWERWVGVRGAAALGASILVLAGLYFFKYSIDHGLISPALRVVLGMLVGLGGVGASELMLRRRYTVLANWLAGAGIAILYTSSWAANALYGLVGAAPSFALMSVTTVACGLLALRHDAMVIALLGLLGGFVTPMALSTGEDHPVGLFGYLILLDAALIFLSVRKRWAVLGALSLLGTAFYQVAWIGARMGPDRLALGMGIVVVFGALYGVTLPAPSAQEPQAWKVTRAAAVLLPYTFGLYFGLRADLGPHLAPIGVMLAMLSAGAAWMARSGRGGWIAPAAAIADVAVVGAWLAVHDQAAFPLEAAGVTAGLAAVFHGFRELDRVRPAAGGEGASTAPAAVSALGGLFVLVIAAAAPSSHEPFPWLFGWLFLAALAVRQSLLGVPALRLGAAILIALGAPLVHGIHADDAAFPAAQVIQGGVLVVTALAALSAWRIRRDAAAAPPSGKLLARLLATDPWVLMTPFVIGLYVAARVEAAPHIAPLGAVLIAVIALAAWSARASGQAGWVPPAAAIAGLGVLATWMGVHDVGPVATEAAAVTLAFAGVIHAFTELRPPAVAGVARGAAAAAIGAAVVLLAVAAGRETEEPWPFVIAALASAALAARQARAAGRELLHFGPAVVLGVGLPLVHAAHRGDPAFPAASVWLGFSAITAIALLGVAYAAGEGAGRRWASHAAALAALFLLRDAFESPAPPAVVLAAGLALIAVALAAAARLGHGGWAFAATVAGAFVEWGYVIYGVAEGGAEPARIALAGQLAAVALIAAWPLVQARRLSADAWAWRAAALAGPLWFPSLYQTWTAAFGRGAIGLLPILLGAITAGAARAARPALPAEGAVRKSALVWLLAVSLGAVSVAVPLQLENEWVTVGWALLGAALLALWRRLDHAGLKYTALVHLGVVAARLVANPAVLDYHARGALPVLNWLLYTYWIPVAALAGAWWLLREREAERARPWEEGLYAGGQPLFANATAAAAIVVFFVWLNLTIFDAFGQGAELHVAFDRLPARDLTLSLAWAVYALALLALGTIRRSPALRWTSLALIIITAGKAFLYDLSHLHDLYRVMSLVGLALSLIFISLLYQRFVFGRREEEPR